MLKQRPMPISLLYASSFQPDWVVVTARLLPLRDICQPAGLDPESCHIMEIAVIITDGKLTGPNIEVRLSTQLSCRWEHLMLPETWCKSDLNLLSCNVSAFCSPLYSCFSAWAGSCTRPNNSRAMQGPDLVIHQSDEVLETMNDWCKEHHGESGLTDRCRESTVSLAEAESKVTADSLMPQSLSKLLLLWSFRVPSALVERVQCYSKKSIERKST